MKKIMEMIRFKILGISPDAYSEKEFMGIETGNKVVIAPDYYGTVGDLDQSRHFIIMNVVCDGALKGTLFGGRYQIIEKMMHQCLVDRKPWLLNISDRKINAYLNEFDNMFGDKHYLVFHIEK